MRRRVRSGLSTGVSAECRVSCGRCGSCNGGRIAMPSPAAMASASSTAPAAAKPPTAAGATGLLPKPPNAPTAAAAATSEKTAALGATTRAACDAVTAAMNEIGGDCAGTEDNRNVGEQGRARNTDEGEQRDNQDTTQAPGEIFFVARPDIGKRYDVCLRGARPPPAQDTRDAATIPYGPPTPVAMLASNMPAPASRVNRTANMISPPNAARSGRSSRQHPP